MKTINAEYTYALDFDESGNIERANYLSKGSSIVTNSDTLKVNKFNSEQVDYAINHAAENGIPEDVLILESDKRTEKSDGAVNKLVSEGKIIITNT